MPEEYPNNKPQTLRFGLNYVPSKRWYYCWNDWRAGEIEQDLDAMAALGIDHLRIQLVWPWFQPNPGLISPVHLERLRELCLAAQDRGLDVQLTLVTGWLSGYRFLPPNVSGDDVFLSHEIRQQLRTYVRAVASAVSDLPNLLGFDLGNEINVLSAAVSPAQGDAWARDLLAEIRTVTPQVELANGVDHNPWFAGRMFSLGHLVEDYDATCLHAWPLFTGCLLQGGLADAPALHLSAFLTQFARKLQAGRGVRKPVWIQEFGCSFLWGNESERERYLYRSVELAIEAGAARFTWWCSHDLDPVFVFDPLEYSLGLFDTANQAKPMAAVYRRIIQESRGKPVVESPIAKCLEPVNAHHAPAILPSGEGLEWLQQNLHTTTWALFREYLTEKS
jgi:endo-1,4-beta-mannosidase